MTTAALVVGEGDVGALVNREAVILIFDNAGSDC